MLMVDELLSGVDEALDAIGGVRQALAMVLHQLDAYLCSCGITESERNHLARGLRTLRGLDHELFQYQFQLTGPRDLYGFCVDLPVEDAFAPDVLLRCAEEARVARELAAQASALAEESLLRTHRLMALRAAPGEARLLN